MEKVQIIINNRTLSIELLLNEEKIVWVVSVSCVNFEKKQIQI